MSSRFEKLARYASVLPAVFCTITLKVSYTVLDVISNVPISSQKDRVAVLPAGIVICCDNLSVQGPNGSK